MDAATRRAARGWTLIGFLQRNRILAVYCVLYLVVVLLAMLQLDKQYYQIAKKDLIVEHIREYVDDPIGKARVDKLMDPDLWGSAVLENQAAGDQASEFRRTAESILDSADNPVYRITLTGPAVADQPARTLVDLTNKAKFRAKNTFSNSLFLRDFSSTAKFAPEGKGTLSIYYTSPQGDERIRELTLRYRWYAVFLLVTLTLLAGAVARALLIPLQKVLRALEASSPERTVLCRRPRVRLEVLYNRMALDAAISRLQGRLREEIARTPGMSGWEVIGFIAGALREQADLPLVACAELRTEQSGQLVDTGRSFLRLRPDLSGEREALEGWLGESIPGEAGENETAEWCGADRILEGRMQLARDPDRPESRYLLAVLLDADAVAPAGQTGASLLSGFGELVEAGLASVSLRNQLVVKERGRANISLSRNLGHDLTNIIAATKLDLMALERVLTRGPVPAEGPRHEIMHEALGGLLKSVRFMQETVNLYRSYAFLQHPVMEVQDGNALLGETMDLFARSISARIELRRDLAPDAPRCIVDPRLIKLAIFNLFSNSLRAIRRRAGTDAPEGGWIRVATARAEDGGLEVTIEDSGTGIIDEEGQRLPAHEIDKIFDLGFSSRGKGEDGGEGLGLNWVRTIIQDLHGGTIRAENSETAGARLILNFPPPGEGTVMLSAEARAKETVRRSRPGREE